MCECKDFRRPLAVGEIPRSEPDGVVFAPREDTCLFSRVGIAIEIASQNHILGVMRACMVMRFVFPGFEYGLPVNA